MPSFWKFIRQCSCGFDWFGGLRGLDRSCADGGSGIGGGAEGNTVVAPAASLRFFGRAVGVFDPAGLARLKPCPFDIGGARWWAG
jgi:hypothetical protein